MCIRDREWTEDLEFTPVLKLSDDVNEALRMMADIDRISMQFPGLDCGSCGAPSCRALAEDVVRGLAKENQCIFKLREEIQNVAASLASMGGPARGHGKEEEK